MEYTGGRDAEVRLPNRTMFVPTLLRALFPGVTRARVGGWGAFVVLSALLMWLSPMSPAALGHADAALGMGNPQQAVVRYDRVASMNPFPWMRDEALYRGAMVWAVDLRDAGEARKRLEQLAASSPENPRLAEVHEQIGHLLLDAEDRPVDAARAFVAAYEVAPDHARARVRLLSAARAASESGDLAAAEGLWIRVAELWPEEHSMALIARAELHLAAGDAQTALGLYEEAGRAARHGDEQTLARLGAAACLERLGNLEEALAELDSPEIPGSIRDRRIENLRARMAASGAN